MWLAQSAYFDWRHRSRGVDKCAWTGWDYTVSGSTSPWSHKNQTANRIHTKFTSAMLLSIQQMEPVRPWQSQKIATCSEWRKQTWPLSRSLLHNAKLLRMCDSPLISKNDFVRNLSMFHPTVDTKQRWIVKVRTLEPLENAVEKCGKGMFEMASLVGNFPYMRNHENSPVFAISCPSLLLC